MDEISAFQTIKTPQNHLHLFCAETLRKISWAYIGWLLLAVFLSAFIFIHYQNRPDTSVRPSLYVYLLVFVTHIFFRMKSNFHLNILSPENMFILLYTLFHLGYVGLYGFGLAPYSERTFYYYTSIPKAMFIVNLGFISFLMGYELLGSRCSAPRIPGPVQRPNAGWCTFGLIFMVIGLTAHLVTIISIGISTFKMYGYGVFSNIGKFAPPVIKYVWANSLHVMILGVVIYTISSALRYGKVFNSKLALGLLIVYLFLVATEGDRGPILYLLAPVLLVRHYLIKPISVWVLVGILVVFFTLFTVIGPLVRNVQGAAFNPSKILGLYRAQKAAGEITWMNPLFEMGGSFKIVNMVAEDVPSVEPYWYGASWRDAAFHIVPFLQGFAVGRGWGRIAPSMWLTYTYFGLSAAGTGFTMTAEGYLNFGYFGVFLELFFFGAFTRWLAVRFSLRPCAMWGIIMVGCIGLSIMVIRNHTQVITQNLMKMFVMGFLLNKIIGNEPVYTGEYEPEIPYESYLPVYDELEVETHT